MPPQASKRKVPTSPPKFCPPSRKRTLSITPVTAITPGNKRSRRSTRLTRDEVEEVEEDMSMDVDKPVKGGWKEKKEKKGGKAAKEKRAEEKKFFFFFPFIVILIGFTRLLLEKNGPSPRSKAKKIQ